MDCTWKTTPACFGKGKIRSTRSRGGMRVSRGLREEGCRPFTEPCHPKGWPWGLLHAAPSPRQEGQTSPCVLKCPHSQTEQQGRWGGSPAVAGGTERGSATRFYNKGTSWVLCLIACLPGYTISVTTHAHRHTRAGRQGV